LDVQQEYNQNDIESEPNRSIQRIWCRY